jgi:hypothetical protein
LTSIAGEGTVRPGAVLIIISKVHLRFTLSLNPDALPKSLATPVKVLAGQGSVDWWHRARERGQCLLFRLQRRLHAHWLSRSFTDHDVTASTFCSSRDPVLPQLMWQFDPNGLEVESLLCGTLTVFGSHWNWSLDGSCWHRAPDTGQLWPRRFFDHINVHPGNPYGDIRAAWEPSRLQHLITLALLAREGGSVLREKAVAMAEAQLISWVEANPAMIGIHYVSPAECALRLLAVCYAMDLLRPWLQQPQTSWRATLTLVFRQAEWIRRRLSIPTTSSHGTLACAVALIHDGSLFPESVYAERWSAFGSYLLEEETPRHISQDGGGREQGFGYLRFSTDLYGLILAIADHRSLPIPDKIRLLFDQSRRFLHQFSNLNADELPPIGDGESEIALSPFLRFPVSGQSHRPGLTTFHLSGYSIIRGPRSERAIFDHGPLGMPPFYAHAHADALSFLLQQGRQEVLIDPGTYTYTGDERWRAYFRGTSAHNTVTIDRLDQAVQKGPLAWSHPFETHLVYRDETPEGKITVIARHYGYKDRLGVTHLRGISYDPSGSWMIWDWLTGSGTHRLELNWHVGCRAVPDEEGYLLEGDGMDRPLSITIEGGSSRLYEGSLQPMAGWKSTGYQAKKAITTIRIEHTGPLPHEFMTRIRLL